MLIIFVLKTCELVQKKTPNFVLVVKKKVENDKLVQVCLSLNFNFVLPCIIV